MDLVGAKFARRDFLAAAAASAAIPSYALSATATLRPEDFGARGDGVNNDTPAFQALAAAVNRNGGGVISLTAGRTYIVGSQHPRGALGWAVDPVLELHHLQSPLAIHGHGARLRCQPRLRFGSFDPVTGQAVHRPMPNLDRAIQANVYRGMIHIHDCQSPVTVDDLELDGNRDRLHIGGPWGDTGWQVAATGIMLENNSGPETLDNIFTHHHGTDGMIIVGADRSTRSRITRLLSRFNGRQGLSITGGSGYDLFDCEFSQTAKSGVHSAPGAGVDIEAEGGRKIRDLSFTRCRFVDNGGCGMVADSGDSADLRFADCDFVGTTSWSAWPRKPGFKFEDCRFVGSVVHAFADSDPGRATHFVRCLFTDDPRLSPTGKVYVDGGPIANLGESDNVLFDACTFRLVADGLLPWSSKAIYRDCLMSQHSSRKAMTKGKYLGRSRIDGEVDLDGSMVGGALVVNGRDIPRGPVGGVAAW